ncbi:MAG: hypothetical protein AAGA77_04445 [Bacteroidota bacterium]
MKKVLIILYVLCWLIIGFFIYFNAPSLEFLFTNDVLITIHLLFATITAFILFVRFLYISVKENRKLKALKILFIRIFLPITIVFFGLKGIFTYNQSEDFHYDWNHTIENHKGIVADKFDSDEKFRGMSVYALGKYQNLKLDGIIKSNVEWLAVHPYISQMSESSPSMSVPEQIGQWSQSDSSLIQAIQDAKSKGFRIMMKPHLFLADGWRANIHFDSDADWNTWYSSYQTNLLHCAYMAEEAQVELLCLGTELESSMANNPVFWMNLVNDVHQVYTGKITYAANWDSDIYTNYQQFWEALDYIGIQAYFPLTTSSYPDIEIIKTGWDQYTGNLEQISNRYKKPILFTELGYRADGQATVQPWQWDTFWSRLTKKKSEQTQLLAYEAFFQKVWNQDWFAGVFIWQWNRSIDFSIKGKPAQNSITGWYGRSLK